MNSDQTPPTDNSIVNTFFKNELNDFINLCCKYNLKVCVNPSYLQKSKKNTNIRRILTGIKTLEDDITVERKKLQEQETIRSGINSKIDEQGKQLLKTVMDHLDLISKSFSQEQNQLASVEKAFQRTMSINEFHSEFSVRLKNAEESIAQIIETIDRKKNLIIDYKTELEKVIATKDIPTESSEKLTEIFVKLSSQILDDINHSKYPKKTKNEIFKEMVKFRILMKCSVCHEFKPVLVDGDNKLNTTYCSKHTF